MSDRQNAADVQDFSLVMGGPLYRFLLTTRLARPPLDLLRRRVVVIAGIAWLPLLFLAAVEGHALEGVAIPFLKDLDAHVRLLVALPLLVLAETVVHERFRPVTGHFLGSRIIRTEDRSRFDEVIASTSRWRNSIVVEALLLVFAFTVGHTLWAERLAVQGDTWFTGGSGSGLSRAGLWYAWVSLPVFQFILLRWWYRLLLWIRLLWLVSRLDLDLVPVHPDRAGGLGFLGASTAAFAPLLAAQTALVSAMAGGRILQQGAALQSFKVEIAGMLAFALFQALGPLLVFGPALARAKRRGLLEYGLLGDRYVREFDRKWIRGGAPPEEASSGPPTSSLSPTSTGVSRSSATCGRFPSGRRRSSRSSPRRRCRSCRFS
jgi:hypothetical protein